MERNRLHVRSHHVVQRRNTLNSCCLLRINPFIRSFSSTNIKAYSLMLASLTKLSWLVAWHIRDETYSKALAEIVNYHHQVPFAPGCLGARWCCRPH